MMTTHSRLDVMGYVAGSIASNNADALAKL
jgi:hypothetical protein